MEEYDITPKDQGSEGYSGLPAIIVSQDKALIIWYASTQEDVAHAQEIAGDLIIVDDAQMQEAVDLRNKYRARRKEVLERIGFHKDRVNRLHDQIMAVEKELAGDERKQDGGYQKAMKTLTDKINLRLDYLDEQRRLEEARLSRIAEADRQKRQATITKGLDKLLSGLSDLNEQRKALEARVGDPETTVEEAEEIRSRINAIDALARKATAQVDEKQVHLEQVTAPATIVVDNKPDVKGMSSKVVYFVERIVNDNALHQAVIDGKAPRTACTWNFSKLAQAANDQVKGMEGVVPSMPGVAFGTKRVTTTRAA